MSKAKKPLFTGYEWNPDLIDKLWTVIDDIGKNILELDYYEPQFEVVTSEMMIDAYCSVGMPIFYNHWSFGKQSARYKKEYEKGRMGLAYEMVINSNPCIAYLMEDNTACLTALVIAHANCGHAHFFKNNYLFKQHTKPDEIIPYLEYAKRFINKCEEDYGIDAVEILLDKLHIIQKFGVDKYPRKDPISQEETEKRSFERAETQRKLYDHVYDSVPKKSSYTKFSDRVKEFIDDDEAHEIYELALEEENLLRVIEQHSIILEPWQKEIVKITRHIEQYFYPQAQTKVMNEGWACFVHYFIMSELYNTGYIDEGAYLEFLQSHTAVCHQPDFAYLNPYALGFAMFMDLKRACETPDDEDYRWLKSIAGKGDWKKELKNIVKYYKDESFVLQFLSPKIIRKFKLFTLHDDNYKEYYTISNIHSEEDVEGIRRALAKELERDNRVPDLVVSYINRLDNEMTIEHRNYNDRELDEDGADLLRQTMTELTGLSVHLTYVEK